MNESSYKCTIGRTFRVREIDNKKKRKKKTLSITIIYFPAIVPEIPGQSKVVCAHHELKMEIGAHAVDIHLNVGQV